MLSPRSRAALKPEVIGLESRDVPTVVSPLAFGGAGLRAKQGQAAAMAPVSPAATTDELNFNSNPEIDPSKLSKLGLAASRFAVLAGGPYSLAGSYFSDVSKQIIYLSKFPGTTGQMRHGTMIMRVAIPADPTAPIHGVAVLRVLSNSTTGNQLVLELTATAVDAQGRPTQFT
jgi:hypothetical protein